MFYRVRNHAVFRKNIKLTEGTPVMTKVRNHAFIGIIRIIRRINIPADLQQMKLVTPRVCLNYQLKSSSLQQMRLATLTSIYL